MIIPIIKLKIYDGTNNSKTKFYTKLNNVLDDIIFDLINDKCKRAYIVEYTEFKDLRLYTGYIRLLHWIDEEGINHFNLSHVLDTDNKECIIFEINKLRR